jgi:hypothetical protein
LERAYQDIPAVDLSREVFAPQPHRLLAICDAKSGWTDLGSPARVMEILSQEYPPNLVSRGTRINAPLGNFESRSCVPR